MGATVEGFPLFPLGLVALPGELVPLHIFEDRYKQMIGECLDRGGEFGIVWLSGDGLKRTGCACEVEEVLRRYEDGRLDIAVRGTRPFAVVERQADRPWPAGTVRFLEDKEEVVDEAAARAAREAYVQLVREATDRELSPEDVAGLGAFAMAATVDFGLNAKQGLLDLRSENARLRLVGRLLRAALAQLERVDRAKERAASNGRVHFGR